MQLDIPSAVVSALVGGFITSLWLHVTFGSKLSNISTRLEIVEGYMEQVGSFVLKPNNKG